MPLAPELTAQAAPGAALAPVLDPDPSQVSDGPQAPAEAVYGWLAMLPALAVLLVAIPALALLGLASAGWRRFVRS